MNDNLWYTCWFNKDYMKLYAYRDQIQADQEVSFIISALQLKGNERILDLGCGTGRHSLSLAAKGYDVVGVDISKPLIDEAKKKLEGLNPRFVVADIFELPDLGQFDLVLNLFTSFGYFKDDKDNLKMLKIARSCLKPNGKFILDYLHPREVLTNLIPRVEQTIAGEKVVITKEILGDRVIKSIEFPGRRYQEKVKLYDRNQIELFLRAAGFAVVQVWNDYLGNPWKIDGDRQIFLCVAQE